MPYLMVQLSRYPQQVHLGQARGRNVILSGSPTWVTETQVLGPHLLPSQVRQQGARVEAVLPGLPIPI